MKLADGWVERLVEGKSKGEIGVCRGDTWARRGLCWPLWMRDSEGFEGVVWSAGHEEETKESVHRDKCISAGVGGCWEHIGKW